MTSSPSTKYPPPSTIQRKHFHLLNWVQVQRYFIFLSFYSYSPSEICPLSSIYLQTNVFSFLTIAAMVSNDKSTPSNSDSYSNISPAIPAEHELSRPWHCHCWSQDCVWHPFLRSMQRNYSHQASGFCCCHFRFSYLYSSKLLKVPLAVSLSFFPVPNGEKSAEKVLCVFHHPDSNLSLFSSLFRTLHNCSKLASSITKRRDNHN